MKKFFALILIAASLLTMLAGCGPASVPVEISTMPTTSGITAKEVLDTFELLILESELSDYYTTTRLPADELPETGDVAQSLVITDKTEGYSFQLHVYSTAKGDVYLASINHFIAGYGYIAFPTFCLYLIDALGLTEVDAMGLCDHFGLLSRNPSGLMSVNGWDLMALNTDNLLSFSARYQTK